MSVFARYLPSINSALAQRGQAESNAWQQGGQSLGNIINVLAQMAQQQQLKQEQLQKEQATQDFFNPSYETMTPQQNVGTDLLGVGLQKKPVSFYPQGDARNYQMPTPQNLPALQERGNVDLRQDPRRLFEGLMNTEPMIQKMAQQGIQALQLQAPKYEEYDPTKDLRDVNPFSRTAGTIQTGIPKPQKQILDTRNVLDESGKPQMIDVGGIKFTVSEKYDRNTGQSVPNSYEFKKQDDATINTNPYYNLSEKRLVKSYQSSFNADPTVKTLKEQGLSLSAVDGLIKQAQSGNQVASAALGVKMAKVMGEVGMLSESDVTRYVQARSLTQGGADVLSKWIKGTPTGATLSQIQEIAKVLRNEFLDKSRAIVDQHIQQMSSGLEISPSEARKLLGVEELYSNPSQPSKKQNDIKFDVNDFENWRKGKK